MYYVRINIENELFKRIYFLVIFYTKKTESVQIGGSTCQAFFRFQILSQINNIIVFYYCD